MATQLTTRKRFLTMYGNKLEQIVSKIKAEKIEVLSSDSTSSRHSVRENIKRLDESIAAIESATAKAKELLNDYASTLDQVGDVSGKEEEDFQEYNTKVESIIMNAYDYLVILKAQRSALFSSTQFDSDLSSTVTPSRSQNLELPTLPIPTFSGNVWEWDNFWELFENNIHSQDIPELSKFNYLLRALKGEAREAVKKFQITSNNYINVIQFLKKKYDNSEIIINHLIDRLDECRLQSASAKDQRTLLEQTQTIMNQLLRKGEQVDSSWLIKKVLSKFPDSTKRKVITRKQSLSSEHTFTMNSLFNILDEIIAAEEMFVFFTDRTTDGKSSSSRKSPTKIMKTLFCMYCKENHSSFSCTKYRTAEERSLYLRKNHLCLICASANHRTTECKKKQCFNCQGAHHTSCCFKNKRGTNNTSSYSADLMPTKQQKHPVKQSGRPSRATSQSKNTNALQVELPSQETPILQLQGAVQQKSKEKPSLPVGIVTITNPSTKISHRVPVLFDTGAEISFIDRHLADQLDLPVIDEKIVWLHTFGAIQPKQQKCKRVHMQIEDNEGHVHSLKLLTHDTLTQTLQRPKITEADREVIQSLNLSAQMDEQMKEVNPLILLGCDHLWAFIKTDTPPVKLPSGMYLLPTKLGSVISGTKEPRALDEDQGSSSIFNEVSTWDNYWSMDAQINTVLEETNGSVSLNASTTGMAACTYLVNSSSRLLMARAKLPTIHNLTDQKYQVQIGYIPSDLNPADIATRGSTKESLQSQLWWNGPSFLLAKENDWPTHIKIFKKPLGSEKDDDQESPLIYNTTDCQPSVHELLLRQQVLTFTKAKRITALSTTAFIQMLRRFFSRRGIPKSITSDNAPTFALGEEILTDFLLSACENAEVAKELSNREITWKKITPFAPWQGGFYERLIKSVKCSLYKTLGKSPPTAEELATTLIEIEALLNTRPLTYLSNDINELEILRPIDFLQKDLVVTYPWEENKEKDASFLSPEEKRALETKTEATKAILSSCKATEKFWKLWQGQYLPALREKHVLQLAQKKGGVREPKVGAVVLIQDAIQPRYTWKIAVIKDLLTNSRGTTRTAVLRLSSGRTIKRPINLLIPLELEDEEKEMSNQHQQHHERIEHTQAEDQQSRIHPRYNLRQQPRINYDEEAPQTENRTLIRPPTVKQVNTLSMVILSFLTAVIALGDASVTKSIQCIQGGVQLSMSDPRPFEICTEGFCYQYDNPNKNETVILPPQETLHEHPVWWKISQEESVQTLKITCPPAPFCQQIKNSTMSNKSEYSEDFRFLASLHDIGVCEAKLEEDMATTIACFHRLVTVSRTIKNECQHYKETQNTREAGDRVLLSTRLLRTASTTRERLIATASRYIFCAATQTHLLKAHVINLKKKQAWARQNLKRGTEDIQKEAVEEISTLDVTIRELEKEVDAAESQYRELQLNREHLQSRNIEIMQLFNATMATIEQRLKALSGRIDNEDQRAAGEAVKRRHSLEEHESPAKVQAIEYEEDDKYMERLIEENKEAEQLEEE
ncbi:Tas retrotransposon peptidase A16, partial [Oesophagostomum dentatum]